MRRKEVVATPWFSTAPLLGEVRKTLFQTMVNYKGRGVYRTHCISGECQLYALLTFFTTSTPLGNPLESYRGKLYSTDCAAIATTTTDLQDMMISSLVLTSYQKCQPLESHKQPEQAAQCAAFLPCNEMDQARDGPSLRWTKPLERANDRGQALARGE